MIRITCSCETCKINAEKVGAPFPLAADVPDVLGAVVKAKAARHSFVYAAHDPNPVTGAAVRARTGIIPVR